MTHGVPIKKIEANARMRIINYFPDPTDVKKFHLIVKLDMDFCFLSQNYNNAIHKTNHTGLSDVLSSANVHPSKRPLVMVSPIGNSTSNIKT